MKLLCKLHLHKYEIVKRISGGDYPKYIENVKDAIKQLLLHIMLWETLLSSTAQTLTSQITCSLKNGLINIWIEVEMKRFRLVSNSFIDQNGALRSKQQFVEADSSLMLLNISKATQVGTLVSTELSKSPISRRLWNER